MLRKKTATECEFCGREYYNKKEMLTHQYFHKNQEYKDLELTLNTVDPSYSLPSTSKAVTSKEQCLRVAEFLEEKFVDGKPRSMLDKIKEVKSLTKKYPLKKSSNIIYSDTSQDEDDGRDDFEAEYKPIIEYQRLEDLNRGIRCSTSYPKKSISRGSYERQQVEKIQDIDFYTQAQKKLDTENKILVFDCQDSTSNSYYRNQNRISGINLNSDKHSKNFVPCSVINSNLAQVAAFDHSYFKKTPPPNTAPMPDLRYDSAFLSLVENAVIEKDPFSGKYIPSDTEVSPGLYNDLKIITSTYDPRMELNSSFNGEPAGFGNTIDSATT